MRVKKKGRKQSVREYEYDPAPAVNHARVYPFYLAKGLPDKGLPHTSLAQIRTLGPGRLRKEGYCRNEEQRVLSEEHICGFLGNSHVLRHSKATDQVSGSSKKKWQE